MQSLHGHSVYRIAGKSRDLRISDSIDHDDLVQWVRQEKFLKYEKEENKIIPRAVSNRVSIYTFRLPWHGKNVVMKVSRINPDFRVTRKIELLLRGLVKKDYNKVAFEGCCALQSHGIPVANPLGFWTIHKGLNRVSYFLYEKIEKTANGQELAISLQSEQSDNAGRCLYMLMSKVVQNIKNIHKLGWRHGDPAPKNFLFNLPVPFMDLKPESLERTKFYLIDYDKCRKATIRVPLIKKFFDFKDLKELKSLGLSFKDIFEEYQGGKHSYFWYAVLQFWLRGGFRLGSWLKKNSYRGPDSHLKGS